MIKKYNILNGAKYFGENRSQNYLIIQPISIYFTYFRNTAKGSSWTSKGILEGSIQNPPTADTSFAQKSFGD